MLADELEVHLEETLNSKLRQVTPLSGGDIHQAYRLQYGSGSCFIKLNQAPQAYQMFETEAQGLDLLRNTGAIPIPEEIGHGQAGRYAYLLLEYIPPGQPSRSSWQQLGHGLAQLHRETADQFGLDHDNFIGLPPQYNGRHDSFADFYFQERLWPQFRMAHEKGLLSAGEGKQLEDLGKQLPQRIPEEPPALVHGDLWSGNFLVDQEGKAYLIDPAVAFSHREADLAMTRLFGGFAPDFYVAYEEAFPLQSGWQERISLFQLYYLLVHLNVFGRSYYASVKAAMQ